MLFELNKYTDKPGLLKVKILEHAAEFNSKEILNYLATGNYSWLSQALLETRADSALKDDQMLGLMMAMTSLGAATAAHVGTFVADLQ